MTYYKLGLQSSFNSLSLLMFNIVLTMEI